MATIKISELFPIEEFKKDDLLEVVQDGKSRRASLEQLDEYMGSNLPITTEEDAGDLLQVDDNGKWNKATLINKPNGIAPLDGSGKVPSKNLPSYVDDVIEGYYFDNNFYSDPNHEYLIIPETGKIYLDITDNRNDSYRWVINESGGLFIKISSPIDISTIIDEYSTDSTIPTSKAVYNFIKDNPEIPTITIDYSQMISGDTIQFTEEQWEILTDDETKILFVEAPRWVVDAKYKILYKCGAYSELPSRGALYYEIIGNSSQGVLILTYRLNGEERQLKMQSDASPFVNNDEPPTNGDMLKINSDRISKAIPNEDYALPTVHLTIENSQITTIDNSYRFILTDNQWNEYLKHDELLRVSLEVEVGEFEEYTFVKRFSGEYYTFSNGAYLDYITLGTYDVQHKILIISSPMAVIPTHRGVLSDGDLLKCQDTTIYPAVPDVDYLTKTYLENHICKEVDTLNIWDLGENSDGAVYKVRDSIYYGRNKIIPNYNNPQYLIVFKRQLISPEDIYLWNWICFSADNSEASRTYSGVHIYLGHTFISISHPDRSPLGDLYYIESREFLDTVISASSSDTHYPSSKAVYNAIQAALYVDSEGEI